eukprot:GHRR01023409.1.p1 GENE.GHRR01023409.1~~GHRR01023409.1.p1  ORF type:complete len:275 (+),score=79.98 GHRR01023409.1:404-1228(+)
MHHRHSLARLPQQHSPPCSLRQPTAACRLPARRRPWAQAASSNHDVSSSFHEDIASTSAPSTSEDLGYMQEYAALKQQLLNNTRKSGGAIGLYLLLTVNGAAALAAMLGAAGSYAYFSCLCRDVDSVKPTDTVPIWEANKIQNVLLRRAAKVKAAYQAALQPRLLVPVGLACLIGIYNAVSEEPLPLVYTGCFLLGFLSHKAALIVKLVDDLTPKSFMPEAQRPVVERFEDELDQWGRPKKKLANPIDVMPEDQQQKAYEQLEKQMEKEQRRQQ